MKYSYTSDFDTHRPVLTEVVKLLKETRISLRVLEIGSGMGSTPHLRSLLNSDDYLLTCEGDQNWYGKMTSLYTPSDNHQWVYAGDSWYHTLRDIAVNHKIFDLVFVDSSPWDSRTMALDLFSNFSSVMVIHDVDFYPREGVWGRLLEPLQDASLIGKRDYQEIFKFWQEVFPNKFMSPTGPPTLVGSNINFDFLELTYKDCYVSNLSDSTRKKVLP